SSMTILAVLAKIVIEEAPRLRALGLDVPAPLDALIATMLAKDPLRRPSGGAAVAAALAALDAEPARSSHRSGWPERPSLTRAEQRVVCLVLAKGRGGAAGRPA